MTARRPTAFLALAALLAISGCASTPRTTAGETLVPHPGQRVLEFEANGPATLTLRSTGPGWLEIQERYGENAPVKSRRFGPGTRLLRRFRGTAWIRFVSASGPSTRVVYQIEGDADVTVPGKAGGSE